MNFFFCLSITVPLRSGMPRSIQSLIYFTRFYLSFRLPAGCLRLSSAIRSSPPHPRPHLARSHAPNRLVLSGNQLLIGINMSFTGPLIPSFFVVSAFSICTHLTNVRPTRAHHWLSQACLPPSLRRFLRAPSLLAGKAHQSGARGVPFTAFTSSPRLHVVACDHTSGHIIASKNDYPVTLHPSSHASPSHTSVPRSRSGAWAMFSSCPEAYALTLFPCLVSPARDYANLSSLSNPLTTCTCGHTVHVVERASTIYQIGQRILRCYLSTNFGLQTRYCISSARTCHEFRSRILFAEMLTRRRFPITKAHSRLTPT